jgi:hypothetical protein
MPTHYALNVRNNKRLKKIMPLRKREFYCIFKKRSYTLEYQQRMFDFCTVKFSC